MMTGSVSIWLFLGEGSYDGGDRSVNSSYSGHDGFHPGQREVRFGVGGYCGFGAGAAAMNAEEVGEFIQIIFMPYIPIAAGGVIAIILALLLIVLIRYFLPESLSL